MREKILDTAEMMVQDRGLNAVSFQHLADAVGLSKPSVFHHFRNKEALALALIDRCNEKYGEHYSTVARKEISALEKLREFAGIFETGLKENHLCLLAAMGNSVATLPDCVRDDLRMSVAGATDRLSRIFEQGRRDESLDYVGSPEDVATAFFAMLQGLQVLARARRDYGVFTRSVDAYLALITKG